jgi:hypothetical protein
MDTHIMMHDHAPVAKPAAVTRRSSDDSDAASSCSTTSSGGLDGGAGFPPALDPMVSMVVGSLRQRVNMHAIRSLFSVMGIGEAEPFGVPAQAQMLTRMRVNAHYFFANYLLMTLCVFAFLLLFFHPIQLLACIAVAYGWYIFLTKEQLVTGHFVVYGKRVGEQELLLFATACTFEHRDACAHICIRTNCACACLLQLRSSSCSSSSCPRSSSPCP